MTTEANDFVPTSYAGWSNLLQCVSGTEQRTPAGRLLSEETLVRFVRFPRGLIAVTSGRGTVNQVGNADQGYKLRVRGLFPSREQATFVVQRAAEPTHGRDFWIGVSAIWSMRLYFQPIWQEHDYIPSPDETIGSTSPYMPLEQEEYLPLAKLLVTAAHKNGMQDTPIPIPDIPALSS